MTPLVGRDVERDAVLRALADARRCVLVGTGGMGKTSLARLVADERRRADDRVLWVDTEPLDDAPSVAGAVLAAAGVEILPDESSIEVVARLVAELDGLIVLDGVEHMEREIAALVAGWPIGEARVLVTSRVPLEGVSPVVRLAPLGIEPSAPLDGPAGRLLVALVTAQGRTDEDPVALAAAVVATGGLPLAVELAARQIARFGARFAALDGALSTVDGEAVIDRSVDRTLSRLGPDVGTVYAALGYTADASTVELVAGLSGASETATLAALGVLVDHGLVHVVDGRFDLLPPIRDRAARLVDRAADLSRAIAWATGAAVGDGRDEPASYRLLDRHEATFVHLAWLAVRAVDTADAGERAARYLNALYTPLSARMRVQQLMWLYGAFFDAVDANAVRLAPDVEAHTARYAAMATSEGAPLAAGHRWLDRAERAARQVPDPDLLVGRIWSIRSVLAIDGGELARGEQEAHRAMQASQRAGEPFFVEQSRRHLAEVALQRGDLDAAGVHIEQLLSWARGASTHHEYVAMTVLGWINVERGDRAAVSALARAMREGVGRHVDYDTEVSVEADLIWLAVDPSRLAITPEWQGDATWWLRLEQRVRRAGALPIHQHWEHVLHTAADILVLADTVPMMQPRLAAGLLLGDAALAGGDTVQARLAYGQVLREGVRRGYRLRVADALDGIAVLAGRSGHEELAGQAVASADRLRDRCGARRWVRPSLPDPWPSPQSVPQGWVADGWLTLAAADEIERVLLRRAPTAVDAALTRAERQVARLVAEGLSNTEIAAALVISRRTVESHLGRVFRKLGIRNRTQLARMTLADDR